MLKKLFLTFLVSTKRKSKSTLAITTLSSNTTTVSPTSSSIHLPSGTSSFSRGSHIYKKTLQPIFFRASPSLYPGPHEPETSLSLSSGCSCKTTPENGPQTKLGNESAISTSPGTTGNSFQGYTEDKADAEPHKDSRNTLPFPLQHQPTCEGKAPVCFPAQNWAAYIKYRNEGQGFMSCSKIRVNSDPGCLQDWHLLGHSHLVWNEIKEGWEWGKEQLNSIKLKSSSCAAWKLHGNVKVKSTYFKNETPIAFKHCQSLGTANYSPDQLEVSRLNSS